ETARFKAALYGYIAQIDTEESLLTCISSITKSIESNQGLIDWIRENVAEKVLALVTDAYVDTEASDESQERVAPSPIQALASIKERLSQTSSIAPTKRDYSVERIETPPSSPQSTPKPIFDIYREPPVK
ncbi:MAG: hypothetical protein AAB681_01200, partial [Patescibacteria group bacterium]